MAYKESTEYFEEDTGIIGATSEELNDFPGGFRIYGKRGDRARAENGANTKALGLVPETGKTSVRGSRLAPKQS